jgi:acyl carrier protein
MEKLVACLRNVFIDLEGREVGGDLHLGEIPSWDSLNRLNLLYELEAAFSVELNESLLTDRMRVAELLSELKAKGAAV